MKFGFVKSEKTVSDLLQVAWFKESLMIIMIEQETQEWGCVRQKLDESEIERYLGIDEFGWSSWHFAADGHSCQRRSWIPLSSIVVERASKVYSRFFHVFFADIEAHTVECPRCAALASYGKATKSHDNECRKRNKTIIERTWQTRGEREYMSAASEGHSPSVKESEQSKETKIM